MAAAAAVRGWAELPTELLGSIAKCLTVEDYIRFGAVCTSWGSAASPRDGLFLPLAPQMPWLLLPGDDGECKSSCSFVTLPDRRRRRIAPLPEMRGKWCIGSQDGWLALLDEFSQVSLLNPLTRSHILLPSVGTITGVKPVYNSGGSISEFLYTARMDWEIDSYTPDLFRCISFKKLVLSSRPTAGSYTAIAIFSFSNKAAFATAGGGKWTLLRTVPSIKDVIYHDGKFLAASIEGELWAIDVAGPSPQTKKLAKGWGPMSTGEDKYLVDSLGDLLLVWRDVKYVSDGQGGNMMMTKAFKIMKFNPQQEAWVPLKSLGDRSLFLGLSHSISLSALEISDLKRDCIYFTEVMWDWVIEDEEANENKQMIRDVGVFNLEDGTFDRYFPPDRQLNWPPPLWFAPSLHKY